MIPESLVLLAGFVLAHAAWSASDLSKGELLVPLAIVEKNGQRQLLRFEAPTQEQAIAAGKAALAQRQPQLDAWAFVRQGVFTEGARKMDVLSIDAWANGMARPITFVQPFSPYSSGAFRIRGSAMAVVDGKALKGADADRLVRQLYEGVLRHPKVAPLWQGWRAE
jgi:hypothetical protein